MAEAYLNADDMTRYLDSSICLYDGHPYYVVCNLRYPKVSLYKLDGFLSKAWKSTDHTDPLFCDRSPTLGYITVNNHCFYLQRIPLRQQNQGIKQNIIQGIPVISNLQGLWFTSPHMENCILGKHATIQEARNLIDNKGHMGSSIHRHVAISRVNNKNIGLYYKGRLVALWDIVPSHWTYLQNSDTTHIERIIDRLGVL